MDKKELEKLVEEDESETVEFKSSLSEWKEALHTLSAFAWAGGGKLVFGISKGNAAGVQIGKGTIERLANDIKHNTEPALYPKIAVRRFDGKSLIFVETGTVSGEPVLAFGRAYRRVGKSTHRLSREEYNRVILKKHEQEFDGRVLEDAVLADIEWSAVRWFKERYAKVSGKALKGSGRDLLKSLGCLKSVGSKLKPTNAGMLLFGKEPEKFFPRHYVSIARYPGKEIGTAYLEIKDIKGNLFKIIDGSEKYLKEHIERVFRLKEGQIAREMILQYPDFVIRELITNAVAHRDYGIRGSRILIKMFKDRIEFDSPGGFGGNVSPSNILYEQFSRNPLIVNTFSKVRYIEEMGEGWNRISESIKNYPLKFSRLPEVKGNGRVVVTLFSPEMEEKPQGEDAVARLWHDYGTIMARFRERQISAIAHAAKNGKITRMEYERQFGVSKRTAVRELKEAIGAGILKARGRGRSTYYVLKKGEMGGKGDMR